LTPARPRGIAAVGRACLHLRGTSVQIAGTWTLHKPDTPAMANTRRRSPASAAQAELEGLRARLGGLPAPGSAPEPWRRLLVDQVAHGTAIDGDPLTAAEVDAVLAGGAPAGASADAVRGLADAVAVVHARARPPGSDAQAPPLTVDDVRDLHRRVTGDGGGAWRTHDVLPFRGGTSPTAASAVPGAVGAWVQDADAADPDDGLPALADLHARFEVIRPFAGGNGRVGRLLLDLLLLRRGWPPALLHQRERYRYLEALGRADRGDPLPLADLLAAGLGAVLRRFAGGPGHDADLLLPLAAFAAPALKVETLRAAAQRGRLEAVKRGDQWRTTRTWVDAYLAGRRR